MNILADSIEYLWYSFYGLIAGWGITTTFFAVITGILILKVSRLDKRVASLENRLISAERDYNLTLTKWLKK